MYTDMYFNHNISQHYLHFS